ncbi:glycosyltransferase family 4 protein [Streptomyces longwoodensis]|uniref:glycosyltransferase family 4 protein n=1 Tax=Streptomyces longwoodensis TaxID=68231 RepID=UPI00225357BA|nr:glycosyltransferase family 4 protein [Streptomyces longwoodensis]MCX5000438.1 glycosyltransferase family 4 protein [Streptomyces longwoodensis]
MSAPTHMTRPDDCLVPPSCADGDPLVAARHAFFTRSPVVRWRPGPSPAGGDDLALLLEAEYGLMPRGAAHGRAAGLGREDVAVASLRQAARLGVPLTPEALLAHTGEGPRTAAVLADLWPGTVRAHGPEWGRDALRHALLRPAPGSAYAAELLDLATTTGLWPLGPEEAVRLAGHGRRATRHALWRHLHSHPEGGRLLPPVTEAADPYEALLLSRDLTLPDGPGRGPGALVAQSMLLGGFDTPGQGASGGLSVLLGALGDALADLGSLAGVLTIVTAGHAELASGDGLLSERHAGHWVLRLPVDSDGPPPQHRLPEHRPALAWWATRLLGLLGRPVDVLHVRYADEGSLALAQAADGVDARLVFTATPDPHRRLVESHRQADPRDPGRAHRLRDDLHRVYLADRLVDRAATVVAIPGPSGTRDLVRHFPLLAARHGPAGPPAPPEGIAPYRPAQDEEAARRALLAELFSGGHRPDGLAPTDRDLPLLLCVGRLHPVKQQDVLLRAWLAAGLWRTSTLVLVGGAAELPTAEEEHMRKALWSLVAGRPEAARRLAVRPALPSEAVRRLEHALGDPAHGLRAWYVCPSAKEEFGLAVLEAMEAGLPAAGPRRGGVAHYLRDDVNGVLLDTASAATLAEDLGRLVALPESQRSRLARAGRDTVNARFPVSGMAEALAELYRETGTAGTAGTAGTRVPSPA